MDSLYIDPGVQNSHHSRSRSGSRLSSTASQFQGLNSEILPPSNAQNLSIVQSSFEASSPASFPDQDLVPSPRASISAPRPQQLTPFPILSETDFDANWSFLSPTEEQSESLTPLVRLDPPPQQASEEQPPSEYRFQRSYSNPGTMSTIGIQQYDARFDAGSRFDAGLHAGIRHTYTWPQFEINDHFMPQNPSPMLSPGQLTPNLYEEPKLMAMYSRSHSSSPPRNSVVAPTLSPELRELKRQRDHLRRDSKTQIRRERSRSSNSSNKSYVISQNPSPDLLPKEIPQYTNSLTPSPLLSQGSVHSSPALGSTGFMNSYSAPISEEVPSDIYVPVFSMGPNDFTSAPSFPMAFTASCSGPNLTSFISGRPHSHSLSSVPDHMYRHQMSPKVGSSDSGSGLVDAHSVRVVHSRPKPQCWEHGCNGRQFSTFSNLLRHQREKSGAAQKSSCPNCGAEFTRTTARNGHMAHDKCKQRRNS